MEGGAVGCDDDGGGGNGGGVLAVVVGAGDDVGNDCACLVTSPQLQILLFVKR